MDERNFLSIKYLLAQIVILILIVSIPLHFYIKSELENNRFKDIIELKSYAEKVANKIYKFSNSDEKEFYFPRSNIFKGAIYDSSANEIFSLLKSKIELFALDILIKDDINYLQIRLKENVFNARTLVVSKNITYSKMIQNVLAILIVVSFLVFVLTFFIIKQSLEPYKKFNIYLENFIKDATHELKTPIGVILLNLDLLDNIYENNKMVKRSKSALKNMIVVYEDLEFFVRKNRVEHPKEHINISDFFKERIEFFMDLINSKNMRVEQNIQNDLYLNFSQLELSRIIDNTISNAIKYSKNGTKIELYLHEEQNNIVLKVLDEGKGIQNIDKIFDRYYRGDKISGGFGIGLSIVKNICDKNSVHVEVKSKLKVGSEFIFTFKKI
ncbi:MAG TPA: HAMP domain-containing histidine kinase [Sulfurospirillum arcachonense]|nr:HAMP domain-containing histidine kinase [Arcobacter sp.]HIP44271.1 HAMP domain-containing histidine kinase [Sulfurospirillum arcachonense]